MPATTHDPDVVWHEVECGSYDADLALWLELAAAQPGPVLELGCGTGRVLLELATEGIEAIGLDRSRPLAEEAQRRIQARGLRARVRTEDARSFRFEERFGLVLAPMQLLQLLHSKEARQRALRCSRDHLSPAGLLALAIVQGSPIPRDPAEAELPLPDVAEVDGWVYSSLPLDIVAERDRLIVTRLRQIVSPTGQLTDEVDEVTLAILSADEVETEARDVGLRPTERREIPETDSHLGSTVVLLERA